VGDPLHVRILGLLLRLYPPSFRRRHGESILAGARQAARAQRGPKPVAVLLDAVLTLGRAWFDVLAKAASRVSGRRLLAAAQRDVGLALRAFLRRPSHGLAIVVTLAVALGANAAIYTVAHDVLLDELPYVGAERIVEVTRAPVRMLVSGGQPSWRVGAALAEHPGVESAATYYPDAGANLVAGQEASRVRITHVSPAFFEVLGVNLLLGPGMDGTGSTEAVLSHRLWRDGFGADPAVIGRTIVLSGRGYQVRGVAPSDVEFPAGTELWLSDPPVAEFFGAAFGPSVVARLRPGARLAVERALHEDARTRRDEAGEHAHYVLDPELVPLRSALTRELRQPLIVLSAAALALLLLGCVNVAGVGMTRVLTRAPELNVRRSLGASRSRLFGQLMAEHTVLAILAGLLSVLIAAGAVPLLIRLLPAGTVGAGSIRPDGVTLLFIAAATVLVALVAGVPPAVAGTRISAADTNPDRLRGDGRGQQRVQGALTSVQIALAMLLVAVSSLLGRSMIELRAVPLGYDTEGVLTFEVRLPLSTYSTAEAVRRYATAVNDRLAALPGVVAVGITDRLPLADGLGIGGGVWRADRDPDTEQSAVISAASPDYFAAMGIGLLAGRSFAANSAAGGVILSEALATLLFGDDPAVGSNVTTRQPGGTIDVTVVGVVEDTRLGGADAEPARMLYRPIESAFVPSPAFAVRTTVAAAALAPEIRRALREVDAAVPPHALRSTGAAFAETLAALRAAAIVAFLFGLASLILALIAVYTLLAQNVARRRRELGVRLALGATARHIEMLFVLRGLGWTVIGVVCGILLSLAGSMLIQGIVFGVGPRDPRILAVTAAVVLAAALLASWLPAHRAGRTDPLSSLRP
jgi:putative ABC transport system permease protein